MFDFLKLKNALAGLGSSITDLRRSKEALKREREEIAAAPGTKENVIGLFHAHIDEQAARYPALLRAAIENTVAFGRDPCNGPDGRPQLSVLNIARENTLTPAGLPAFERAMFFVYRDGIKKAVNEAVGAMDWPKDARPLAGRTELIAALDKKISDIERDEQDLRRTAADAGVSI